MYDFEEQRQTLLKFTDALKENDANAARKYLDKVSQFPTMKDYNRERGNIAWKAHFVDLMVPALEHESMHPYIKAFFDIAVREDMNIRFPDYWDRRYDKPLSRREMENYVYGGRFPSTSEGAHDTALFLEHYRRTKEKLAKEGREIFVPNTFEEYPFLKDIAEGITRYSNGDLSYETSLGGKITLHESPEISKKLNETLEQVALFKDLNIVKDNPDLRMGLLQSISTGKGNYDVMDLAKFYSMSNNDLKEYNISPSVHQAVCTALKPTLAEKFLEHAPTEIIKKEKELEVAQDTITKERATSVNINENLRNMTDEQRKQDFDNKDKLWREHPIMLEACLNSMCKSYVLTKDETIKKEMLGALYRIRKGIVRSCGEEFSVLTNTEKRDRAKIFKRILDGNPSLKKDENLVALSKIDTPFAQPTKGVKKQMTR